MAAFTAKKSLLNRENVLKQVDSYQLFKAYCRNFKAIGDMFQSELRNNDKHPSCHIVIWGGDLLYKDFGESEGYRIFDYLVRKFNIEFRDVLKMINRDFNLNLGVDDGSAIKSNPNFIIPKKSDIDFSKDEKEPTIINVQPRRWTDADRIYWKQYEIPPLLLKYHNIKSVGAYSIDSTYKDNVSYRVSPYRLAYSMDYYWHNGIFRRKLYFPQETGRYRFTSNVDSTIVQGWTLLPKNGGNVLFVTKSYKDILIFNLLGYWAIAPNSEHSYIPELVMEKLKTRFSNIYVWFDNDEGGKEGAKSFARKFKLPFTFNPDGEPKDPSDFVKDYSLKDFDKLVTQFLNNEGNYNSNS